MPKSGLKKAGENPHPLSKKPASKKAMSLDEEDDNALDGAEMEGASDENQESDLDLASHDEADENPPTDPEDLEEETEEASADTDSDSQGGNAAALAAANSSTEMSASFKNFRHHPDMENFYRFIYENDLRLEALTIIDQIIVEKQERKLQVKTPVKSPAH